MENVLYYSFPSSLTCRAAHNIAPCYSKIKLRRKGEIYSNDSNMLARKRLRIITGHMYVRFFARGSAETASERGRGRMS